MPATASAELSVLNANGHSCGTLRIEVTGKPEAVRVEPRPLWVEELRDDVPHDAVRLREATEYLFTFADFPDGVVSTDRGELLSADRESDGRTGRLRTGMYIGSVPVTVYVDGVEIGRTAFEIRPRKLDYERHYRWMLQDIAEELTETVMDRFAAAEQQFSTSESRDPETLYQRFAFLRSLIAGQEFDAALRQVIGRPHVTWIDTPESRPPGRGMRPSSAVARQLSRAGPRTRWDSTAAVVDTLPTQLDVPRSEVTQDTVPNRFVKFALEHWRDVVAQIGDVLEQQKPAAFVDRGRREVRALLNELDQLLSEELFREIGRLDQFPVGNQVLQKRAGYRDIFRAYIEFELASRLQWEGGADVYSAGQRDVATLYEYWTFFQLAKVVSELCETPLDVGTLLSADEGTLNIELQRGRDAVLRGRTKRFGRQIDVALHFNKRFAHTKRDSAAAGTWTRGMQPDCSLRLAPQDYGTGTHDVWLHFDAKYRVDRAADLFGEDDEGDGTRKVPPANDPSGTAVREDLLKMHAYRDSIRQSSGAYILYPGTEPLRYREFQEILPGLGAFPLVPSGEGEAQGTESLRSFIDDALTHLGSQLSQDDRHRFWRARIYGGETVDFRPKWAFFLSKPPADTRVLLGYVKSEAHHRWIMDQRIYNVRASGAHGRIALTGAELGAEIIVLYGKGTDGIELYPVAGEPEIWRRSRMQNSEYPDPSTELYFCLPIRAEAFDFEIALTHEALEKVRARVRPGAATGAPVACSWEDIAGAVD